MSGPPSANGTLREAVTLPVTELNSKLTRSGARFIVSSSRSFSATARLSFVQTPSVTTPSRTSSREGELTVYVLFAVRTFWKLVEYVSCCTLTSKRVPCGASIGWASV